MPFTMKNFVFWTGVYNAGLALFLLFPSLYSVVGMNICNPVWGWLIAGFLGFTSVVLILASRNLRQRAVFVYWESLLRYIAALVLVPAGIWGDVGLIVVPLGLCDLAIGLVYMFGLTKELQLTHKALLWDCIE
jgi:hypothetical protein